MKPIFKKATYIFYVTIKVNDVVVDIRNDTVTMYVGSTYNMSTPLITKVANVATNGVNGEAVFELTTSDTNITAGAYYLQATWELDGTTRKFLVVDTTVTVKEQIKLS